MDFAQSKTSYDTLMVTKARSFDTVLFFLLLFSGWRAFFAPHPLSSSALMSLCVSSLKNIVRFRGIRSSCPCGSQDREQLSHSCERLRTSLENVKQSSSLILGSGGSESSLARTAVGTLRPESFAVTAPPSTRRTVRRDETFSLNSDSDLHRECRQCLSV